MISRVNLKSQHNRLCNYYHRKKEASSEELDTFYRVLKNYDDSALTMAVNHIMKTSRYFPTPGELENVIRGKMQFEQDQYKTCDESGCGEGLMMFYKIDPQTCKYDRNDHSQLFLCPNPNCESANRRRMKANRYFYDAPRDTPYWISWDVYEQRWWERLPAEKKEAAEKMARSAILKSLKMQKIGIFKEGL